MPERTHHQYRRLSRRLLFSRKRLPLPSTSPSSSTLPHFFAMGKEKRLLFLLPLLSLFIPTSHSATSGDAAVMSDLAKALNNAPAGWKPGSDPCNPEWVGVNCASGRVAGINLVDKSASGTLPDSLAKLSSLKTLALQRNQISGPLPSLANLASLEKIYLDGNAFTSIPPDFFSGLSSLQEVSMDDNPFSPWSIPDELGKSADLRDFSASNASISGTIPDFFGTLSGLQNLRLSYNNLTGKIPSSFAGSNIQNLWLNNQQSSDKLSGRIDAIGSMNQLSLVWLQSNSFTGPIPDVSNLTSLASFNVRDNSLTGLVPASLQSSITLQNASLSNNNLQGPFPTFSASITADIDKGNHFCQQIAGPCDPRVMALLSAAEGFGYPVELATSWEGNDPCAGAWSGVVCDPQGKDIVVLNLANQHFVGTISPDIANLTSLTKLILSNNNLTGSIPDSLTGLSQLQLLDITNNDLSGKIPAFGRSVALKVSGNPLLRSNASSGGASGTPSSDGSGSSGTSPATGGQSAAKSKSSSTGLVAGIVIAVLVLVGCLASLVYYLYHKKHAPKFGRVQTRSPPNEPDMVKIGIPGLNVSGGAVSELFSQASNDTAANTFPIEDLRRATNNFSEDNILGRGGFGVVYKGNLNGTVVAVKRSESGMMGTAGMAEFDAEVHVLRKIRHRHLVSLLGYCRDDNERLLVYEYMPEGTLGQHLFDRNEGKYCALSWKQRLIIALDVARGIEYLHSFAADSFIHRDLKPSNILLDKDMRGKVSDFGLVRLADKEKSVMTRLAGTFGYLAPEYAITGKVSTKVDVYAFGVILMELITGSKALDESRSDEDSHLVTAFRRYILNENKFANFVDSSLNLDQEARGSVAQVAELACHCTVRDPNQRPNMSHAVNVLVNLVEKWNPDQSVDEDNDNDARFDLNRELEKWQSDTDTFSTTTTFSTFKGSTSTMRM